MAAAAAPPLVTGPTPRLWAALAAVAVAVGIVAGMHVYVGSLVRRDIDRFNVPPEAGKFDEVALENLTGVAVQKEAFHEPSVLPVYGSSELTQPQPNRPDDFFRPHPTGFGAFVVAYPGETDLIIATKLAALGAAARGRRAVVFLSPSWFVAPQLDPSGFGINFSPLQGTRLAFSGSLSERLRGDFARRLVDYPDVVTQFPLLKASLRLQLHERIPNRLLQASLWPLGGLQETFLAESDYAKVGLWSRTHPGRGQPGPTGNRPPVDWERLIRDCDEQYSRGVAATSYCTGPRTPWDDGRLNIYRDGEASGLTPDINFDRVCLRSKEWTDLDLLLRTAHELGIKLLLICQPLNANYRAYQGLTHLSSDAFYEHLATAVQPYDATLLTFPAAVNDPHFFKDSTHPSAKAWLVYDRAMDTFYHAPGTPAAAYASDFSAAAR